MRELYHGMQRNGLAFRQSFKHLTTSQSSTTFVRPVWSLEGDMTKEEQVDNDASNCDKLMVRAGNVPLHHIPGVQADEGGCACLVMRRTLISGTSTCRSTF